MKDLHIATTGSLISIDEAINAAHLDSDLLPSIEQAITNILREIRSLL
jgi:hypothetical protein